MHHTFLASTAEPSFFFPFAFFFVPLQHALQLVFWKGSVAGSISRYLERVKYLENVRAVYMRICLHGAGISYCH